MNKQPEKGQLRLWWMPQVPCDNPFTVDVPNLETAILLYKALADYDIYQFETNIKPDYSNMGGLWEWDGNEWLEWEDDDGYSIGSKMDEEELSHPTTKQ